MTNVRGGTSYVPQPFLAYAEVKLGSLYLASFGKRPQMLLGLTHVRSMEDQGNTVTVRVLDKEWTRVESELFGGDRILEFRYGYSGGLVSPWYKSSADVDWRPDMKPEGKEIEISGISKIFLSGQSELKTRVWRDKSISDIVTQIAVENGWKVDERTKRCAATMDRCQGLRGTQAEMRVYNQSNMSDLDFVKHVLAPEAVDEESGRSGHTVAFEDDTKTLIFRPPAYEESPKREYTWWKNKETPVVSWTTQFQGAMAQGIGTGGAAIETTTTNSITGKSEPYRVSNNENTSTKVATGGRQLNRSKDASNLKLVQPAQPNPIVTQARAKELWVSMMDMACYEATMILIGDPTLKANETIKANIFCGNGALDHTSGIYLINEITDTIAPGSFETSLTLLKNGSSSGQEPTTGRVNA